MADLKKPRETIALAKNKLYKTYQFHGTVGRGKEPEYVFKASISCVFAWLRERFRQFDDIPKRLIMPEDPKAITDEMLRSFVIDDGYVIETVYIKEEGIWAFRLTEPDMGSSERAPAPGRLFLTNFGFRLMDGQVEFGCQLICAQPDVTSDDAEVFRPKLVRDLLDKFGLCEFCDLKYQAIDVTKASNKKLFQELFDNLDRQMPIVLLEKTPQTTITIDIAAANIMTDKALSEMIGTAKFTMGVIPLQMNPSTITQDTDFANEADKLARKLAGFAYVFYNSIATHDRTNIYYPGKDSIEDYRGKVADLIMPYPKRNEGFKFGNVLFYSDAQRRKQSIDIKKLEASEDYIAENIQLKEKIINLKKKINEAEQRLTDLADANRREKGKVESISQQQRIDRNLWDDERLSFENRLNALQYELEDSLKRLGIHIARATRPEDAKQFIAWVEEHFDDDIILLARAKDGIRRTKKLEMGALCDAIEVLAYDYKRWRIGEIQEEEYINGCKSRCKTPFEIAFSGEQNIRRFAEEYKVFYNTDSKDNKDRRSLDMHLKHGVDNKFLTRIYFFWDEECSKVVIGSMPEHLSTTTGN